MRYIIHTQVRFFKGGGGGGVSSFNVLCFGHFVLLGGGIFVISFVFWGGGEG